MIWKTAVLGGLVLASASLAGVGGQDREPPPKNISFYTWVREDTFAGWMNNDLARHAKGMTRTQEWLDEHPNDAEATNWLGTGKMFEAARAFEAGDQAGGDRLFQESVALMEKGATLDPNDGGVRATAGGTYMFFARKLPDRHYRTAIEKAREHYAVLYKMQESMLDKFPLHLKGEVLAGVAETEFRVGDRDKGIAFLNRIASGMPGTPYAQTAETWLKAPESVTKQDRLVCQSCHEAGRFVSWKKRQPATP
jgi:hypothetical protein